LSDWSGDGIGLLTKEKVQNESDEGSQFATAGALTAKALVLWCPWRQLVRESRPLAFYDCAHFVRNHADVLDGSSDANDVSVASAHPAERAERLICKIAPSPPD
jgi:hypothetical protein